MKQWFETKNGDYFGYVLTFGDELESCNDDEVILVMEIDVHKHKRKFNLKDLKPLEIEPRRGDFNKQVSLENQVNPLFRVLDIYKSHNHNGCSGRVVRLDKYIHPDANVIRRCLKCGSQFLDKSS